MAAGKRNYESGEESEQAREADSAQSHYFRGNRFYELKRWEEALAEWRRAFQLWHGPEVGAQPARRRFVHLRIIVAVLFTAFLVNQSLFLLYPRNSFDMAVAVGQQDSRSWWERFLDSGRPQTGEGHKITVREWWSRLKQRLRGDGEQQVARERGVGPTVSERWAELLRRYGKWGPFATWDLDYSVISGNGLSRLGDYDGAVGILEKGIGTTTQKEKLADLYQGLANAHYYQGYDLQPDGTADYDLKQVGKAVRAYENSLEYQPRALSYGNLGWMYFLLGNYEKAERESKRALSMNANLHYVRLNLGLVYLMQRRNRESFDAYYEVLLSNPPEEVYLGGMTDLREIMRDNPGRFPFAYLMMGVLALKKGDLAAGRDALTRYLSGPPQGNYWRRLAVKLLEQMDTGQLER